MRLSWNSRKERVKLRTRRYRQETRTTTSKSFNLSGRSGEGYSALRGWRPIPAALTSPAVVLYSGGERPSLSPTGQNFPDEAVSIGKTPSYVKQKSKRAGENIFISYVPHLKAGWGHPQATSAPPGVAPPALKLLIFQLATNSHVPPLLAT